MAAGIAHYALLALVPALGSLVLAYGLFADAATVASHITLISAQLPPSAAELITDQLESVAQGSSGAQGAGLLVALAIALFGARNGARSLMTGLNIAFGVDGPRGFLGGNLMALAITAAGIAGLVLTAAASAALANIAGMFGSIASLSSPAWAAALAAGLLYRFAPHAPAPPGPRSGRARASLRCLARGNRRLRLPMPRISAATTRPMARLARWLR